MNSLKSPIAKAIVHLTDFTEFPRDYLYMGSVSEMPEIRADENIIREILDGLISEQSTQTCTIPISFVRK